MGRSCRTLFSFFSVILLTIAFNATANIRLPRIFMDNMVLQRDKPVRIWGWAAAKESVTVAFNGQKLKTRADRNGNWLIELKPMPMSTTALTMTIEGKNKIALSNILIGDVFICSGQSNMEWTVINANNPEEEIRNGSHPGIRMFTVPKATAFTPQKDFESGDWQVASPQTLANFSAVAYFFGRKIHQETGVPIGLIHSSWGGTNVQAWTSWDIMGKKEAYRNINFTELEKSKREVAENSRLFRAAMEHDKGTEEKWNDPSTGTSDWKEVNLPQIWEQTPIGNVDGIIWFRKEFELPAGINAKTGKISLGAIDDNDITYVNGVQVGATNSYNKERVYSIDGSLLKPGKNTVIVKVTDTGGGGGLYGQPGQLFIEVDGIKIPLNGSWLYKPAVLNTSFKLDNSGPNDFPSQLYNAMIAPVINYALKGGIWYQGEANAGESYKYRTLFPDMIKDWRSKWNDEFPFFWVQLANFMAPDSVPSQSGWAELQEAQSMTLALPRTGQAVIIDIGEANDIHPRNKQDVGYRLALAALKVAYGKDIVYSGPVYQSMQVTGNSIKLNFTNTGSGLWAKDKYGYLKGFAIAGADQKFVWAKASIEGNTIIVHSDAIKDPVAVRYAWANNPADANLYNKEGLPASPFRTDQWPGITVGKNDYK